MPLPIWLPEMLAVSPWTDDTVDQLYASFVRDFKGARITMDGEIVHYFRDVESDGKETIFWHLIEREDQASGSRLPNMDRCARLPWVAAIICNSNQPEVTKWDYRESKGHINTYLWLRELRYVVILRKYENGNRRLVTAHCVDGRGTERTLESKFNRKI